jgi:hypothetical protein
MRRLLIFVALLCLGCATQDVALREARARAQLTHALDEYILAHPHHPYPARKDQLVAFALARHIPLDTSFIAGWQVIAPDTLIVQWRTGKRDLDRIMTFSTNPI